MCRGATESQLPAAMTDYTHYYGIIGDGHVRGKRASAPGLFDPIRGQVLTVATPPSPAATVNTGVRGATSGTRGRIIRILSTTAFVIEAWDNPTFFGQPGSSFIAGAGLTGETVNFDNGGTSTVLSVASGQRYPLTNQTTQELFDAALQTFTPPSGSDTPWYDRNAKFSRQIVLTAASVAGDTQWIQGARITNTTTGATATILGAGPVGSDYGIQIIRATGSWNGGDNVSVTTTATGGAGSDTAVIGSVGADPPQGAWVQHHPIPNLNGTGLLWEFPPNGNGTDGGEPALGPEIFILRKAYEKHAASGSANDRGARTLLFSTFDHNSNSDAVAGGVTLQTVVCTGAFSTNWALGEIVNAGGWSAKLHAFNVAAKKLWVFMPNGATLAGSVTVTGATSGATGTTTGAAIGWQKGSTYYNQFVAEKTTALSRTGALYAGSAAKWEKIFFAAWEAELGMFGVNGATWPSEDQMLGEWMRCIGDFRTELGDPNLPFVLLHMDQRSHAGDVQQFGVPFAYLLRSMQRRLVQNMQHVTLASTDGMEPAQTTGLPYTSTVLFLRTNDYVELGFRVWRAMEFAEWVIPAGNFEPLPLIFTGGQSQLVKGAAFAFAGFDNDPDLYSSAQFPGVNCADPQVRIWNAGDGVKEWQTLDAATNCNTFFGAPAGHFSGALVAIAQRMKRRFSTDATASAEIGFIHLPVNGSSCNAASTGAIATWDPTAPGRLTVGVSMTCTAIAASGPDPARGRFTAAVGTFSAFVVGQQVQVTGSALGFLGFGGNNSFPYGTSTVQAKAADGSTVDLVGPYVTEGATTITMQHGPVPIWTLVEAEVRMAFEKCATQLRRIPKPVLIVWWNGESDLNMVAGYEAALRRVLDGIEDIFGQRHKGETRPATVILQLTRKTPWGVPDADIETMIAAQAAVAADAGRNAIAVSTDKLPMESAGVWPRTLRQHNGIHVTTRGAIMAGYLADQAAGDLVGIPAHPDGEAALDFGVVEGGAGSDDTDAPPSEGGGGGDSAAPGGDTLTATEAGDLVAKIDQAIKDGADIKSYTVNGRTVEVHDLGELLAARKYYASQQQRRLGLRRTLLSFE